MAEAGAIEALLLSVGAEWHAVDLANVREVVPAATITAVPGAPAWLDGLANVRGDLVPVVSTAGGMGIEAGGPVTHLVLADTAGGRVAVASTAAPRPCRLEVRAGSGDAHCARGRYFAADQLCTLVDLDRLTDPT